MRFLDARTYIADRPWGAVDLAEIDGATVRLHWTDQPYVWHVNDGPEIFVVPTGPSTCTTARRAASTSGGSRRAWSAMPNQVTSTSPGPPLRHASSWSSAGV